MSLALFRLAVMYPYDACYRDQRHWRKYHHAVVLISEVIECLRYNLVSEECAAAKKLAEERYYHQDYAIAEGVADSVEK